MRFITQCLFLGLTLGCLGFTPPPAVVWQFDVHLDDHDQPTGKVWLVVEGKRHLITNDPIGGYWIIAQADFAQQKIPGDAVSACSGWYGGVGEDMYVRVTRDRILVFRREYGETSPEIPPYTLFKTISVRRAVNESPQTAIVGNNRSAVAVQPMRAQ